MNYTIDFHDRSRRQLALCKLLSSNNVNDLRYLDEFSSEYIDVERWDDK